MLEAFFDLFIFELAFFVLDGAPLFNLVHFQVQALEELLEFSELHLYHGVPDIVAILCLLRYYLLDLIGVLFFLLFEILASSSAALLDNLSLRRVFVFLSIMFLFMPRD